MSRRGPIKPPRPGRPTRPARGAFTLVELLIVVSIIALLVTLVAPSLERVRELARKAVCKTRLHHFGVAGATYVSEYGTYPNLGGGNAPRATWPKFNGILEMMEFPPTGRPGGMADYQYSFPNEIPKAALCPSLDLAEMWAFLDSTLSESGRDVERKACRFKAGMAYQWSFCLRGPGSVNAWIPTGRWLPGAWKCTGYWGSYTSGWDNTNQTDNPSMCAEAWDSFDPDTIPGVKEGTIRYGTDWSMEHWPPGMHFGPATTDASGWVGLNAARHAGSPNILYAEGSVHSDATRMLKPSDLPGWQYGGLDRARLCSWPEYYPVWGSMKRIVPAHRFVSRLPAQP